MESALESGSTGKGLDPMVLLSASHDLLESAARVRRRGQLRRRRRNES